MPRLAANLSLMFTEVSFMARFEQAAACGFEGVECLFPYAFDADDIATQLTRFGLRQALFNLPPGRWDQGERGLAALPGREPEFRASVDDALCYAEKLGCTRLHVMAGVAPFDVDHNAMRQTFLDNLAYAAPRFANAGIDLLIEPINDRDMPGYFLRRQHEAHALIEMIGQPNIEIQMDCYHARLMGDDPWALWRRHRERIGHIQIAGVPDRNEPDAGDVDYAWLLRQFDAAGYDGWVGCEYTPRGETTAGLDWAAPWLADRMPAAAGSAPRLL